MSSSKNGAFRPALIIVDLQEDFCPPNGSLAVAGGRSIASKINELLTLPFVIKVATQDWHPAGHISFASSHSPPNNKPFESTVTIHNPSNHSEMEIARLWPDHCVQGTPEAKLIPELDISKLDHVVKKGQDTRVEMYSAFRDPFKSPCVVQSNLSALLKEESISHVYVVGLATDYCVKQTALHSVEDGYVTFVVEDATKAVDQNEDALLILKKELELSSVVYISFTGTEVDQVRERTENAGTGMET